jgi:hypothetical protein
MRAGGRDNTKVVATEVHTRETRTELLFFIVHQPFTYERNEARVRYRMHSRGLPVKSTQNASDSPEMTELVPHGK